MELASRRESYSAVRDLASENFETPIPREQRGSILGCEGPSSHELSGDDQFPIYRQAFATLLERPITQDLLLQRIKHSA